MNVSDADLTALAERVSALIAESLRTIDLATKNGDRLERLEREVARISGVEFYRNTAKALLGDAGYRALVARGYAMFMTHADTEAQKDVNGFGRPVDPSGNWYQKKRLKFVADMLRVYGFVNRGHLQRKFHISAHAAATDLAEFARANPGKIVYSNKLKCYTTPARKAREERMSLAKG